MPVPKKKTAQSASETLMRSRPSTGESPETEAVSATSKVSARDILPTRTTPSLSNDGQHPGSAAGKTSIN